MKIVQIVGIHDVAGPLCSLHAKYFRRLLDNGNLFANKLLL